jgi:hypothetical protein
VLLHSRAYRELHAGSKRWHVAQYSRNDSDIVATYRCTQSLDDMRNESVSRLLLRHGSICNF